MRTKKAEPDPDGILSIAFNETCTCFTLGTEHGFQVWDTSPLKPRFKRGAPLSSSLLLVLASLVWPFL